MNALNSFNGFKYLLISFICIFPSLLFSQIPENDDPCPTDSNPPIDLTATGAHTGTTCEATFDYANIDCGSETEASSVWYTFTPGTLDIGYDISISPVGGASDAQGPVTVEVYSGSTNQGCTGFTTSLISSCTSTNTTMKIPNNFSGGEIMYIKVTTATAASNCGEFNLSITAATCEEFADNCDDVTALQTFNPVTNDEFILDYNCSTSCIDYANPDPSASGGCEEFGNNPTVWFQVNVDENAQQLFTTVETNGNWDAVWSIYGGDDCGNLTIITSEGFTCSNDDLTPDLFQIGVEAIYSAYWVAVTVDPNSVPPSGIDDGTFEICVATTINGIVCLGNITGDCAEESLIFEVTEREVDGPLEGPFCPGEEVTINVSFFYDASETSSDWLSGIVPKFGPGWDISNFDYTAFNPEGNSKVAEWIETGSACGAEIQENVPHLCTYIDENGNLALCNNLCESCGDCPTQGMEANDPVPSGYFWVTNGGNAGCTNDCTPQGGWGIGATVVQIDWEFTISVKEYVDYETCFANSDLQISFQTFSQGVVGCWEDPIGECLIDKSQFSPLWKVDCNVPPLVVGSDQNLCSGESTEIFISTENGELNTIIAEVVPNPNISGAMNHTFPAGSGTIYDLLINTSTFEQTVTYNLFSEYPGANCPAQISQITVTVYPELDLFLDPSYVCEGQCTTINYEITGGANDDYTFAWSTGENTYQIEVCPIVATTYSLTITDSEGCTDFDEVQINVAPPVDALLPEYIDVCKDDDFDQANPDYIVCLDFLSGTPPYEITWNPPPGLVGTQNGVFGECFSINEVSSSEFASDDGIYTLNAAIVDYNDCQNEAEMTVHVHGELTMSVEVLEMACGDTEAQISATGFDSSGNPLISFLLYGGCPDDDDLGDFLDEGISPTGITTFPAVDLLSYTCYTIVGQTEAGCQTLAEVTIPIVEGHAIDIIGTNNICNGEEATITIVNADDFVSFEWTPDIGNTGSVSFIPDSTTTYFVAATDANECISQQVFTVNVFALDSEFCVDPCEGQIAEYQITGIAFTDDNANGIQDFGEQPLSNVLIKDLSNNFTVFTNEFGVYILPLENFDVTIEGYISEGDWVSSTLTKGFVLDQPCKTDVNFGFVPLSSTLLASVSVSNTITRCDFESKFYITVENLNHDLLNSTVVFTYDNDVSFFSTNIPGAQVLNKTVTFETGNIEGFGSKTFVITLKMPGGSSNLPLLDFKTELLSDGILLDEYAYDQQLRCSYDPNDKRTFPDRPGDENPTLKEETIEYTIRFQNNGNDTAFHVRIVDVLDPSIIKSSIRFISSSHPHNACLSGDSLIIDFNMIDLIDSTTNYEASQGYVSFSCKVDPSVEFDTEIFNTADIIFDTNAPIVTNTTLNTIVDELCTTVETAVEQEICLGDNYMDYDQSGNYQFTLSTNLGCDSIINLDLLVIEPEIFTANPVTACGDSWILDFEGNTFLIDSSGTYEFEIEGESGCIEEIVRIDVSLILPEEKFEALSICEGDIIEYEGIPYEFDSTGNYAFEIFDDSGCLTQILNFDVTVITSSQESQALESCGPTSVLLNEIEYLFDSTGLYTYFIEGETGCVELELTFDVTINEIAYIDSDTTICEGQSYEGLEVSGVYTLESTDPNTGCPIFETLTLTVLPLSDPACINNTFEVSQHKIKVYPVPADKTLHVESELVIHNAIIVSSTGKVITKLEDIRTKDVTLDISELPSGLHFLMVESTEGRSMQKIIIAH